MISLTIKIEFYSLKNKGKPLFFRHYRDDNGFFYGRYIAMSPVYCWVGIDSGAIIPSHKFLREP